MSRFNHFAETGEDEDYGRGSLPFATGVRRPALPQPQPGAVATAPFYALPLRVLGVGCPRWVCTSTPGPASCGGTGARWRASTPRGTPPATRELKGYVTGLANTRNYTYAWCAVNDMLAAR